MKNQISLGRFLAGMVLFCALATSLSAQGIYGTLTGIVSDPSDAAIPRASVKLRDQQSGSLRETVTNSEGFFTFVSVPPGTYSLDVEFQGFQTYRQRDIAMGGGDKRNYNVTLKVASADTTLVEVTGVTSDLVTVDSGEKSTTLSTKQLSNFIQVGSNAAEFIKIMPGFSMVNGTQNTPSFSGQTIGINGNGGSGSQSPLNNAFSYNGLPTNSLDITADGAHVSDPGCNCATPVNPNSDMISEIKVNMSNFSAENQKGPGVISSVAKSGGNEFHGSGFFYARHYALNSNDSLLNATGVAIPKNKHFYPGFTVGGPVKIPGTNIGKKLFFFTGYEYFYQVIDSGFIRTTVPTLGQRTGNFSPAEIAKEGNRLGNSGQAPGQLNAKGLALAPNGILPSSAIDPSMAALMKLYPQPNADPNTNGGFNYVDALLFNQNNIQWMTRVDYSISDNTKLFVRYNLQKELQPFPIGLWATAGGNRVPYPTSTLGKNRSDSITASLTHVFSPSMTNELVYGYTYIAFPNVFEDPTKVSRTNVGYLYKGLYKNGNPYIPNVAGNQEVATINNQGGIDVGGPRGLYADKWLPSFSDTVSKVWGKHTAKGGIFWEHIRNSQPANNATHGAYNVSRNNPNTLGNEYADLLTGTLNSYNETSFNRINDIGYTTFEGFLQDSWKVNKRLTVDLGVRITHFTPWKDNLGYGFSIFDYSKYNPGCKPTDYCGFVWNKRDSKVPLGGFPTRAAFYQPRFGMALDLFGSGKTVLRGGWGRYTYHSGQFTRGLDVAAGVQTVTLSNNQGAGGTELKASAIDTLNFSSAALSPAAVDAKNDLNPETDSYSFTISQRLPWSSVLEVGYVGNQSRNIANNVGFGSDINLVPVGAMLSSKNGGVDPNTLTANNFRPLLGFSSVGLAENNLYANYNGLQVTWGRTRGRYIVNANYSFGKALGIIAANFDSFNLRNNYGVQTGNRTHIFNTAYSIEVGDHSKHKIVGGIVNGWQISGIVQVQSGANLTGLRGQNFGLNLNSFKIPGTTYNVSSTSLLGTPDIALRPIVTCDPKSNLGPHQFINPSCFSFPRNVGQNGPATLPVLYGPAFFNADLGIFKNFQINERMKLQFRADGYNFLNHPLWSFNGTTNLTLGFDGATGLINTPTFGTATQKQGRRVIQLAVKFYF